MNFAISGLPSAPFKDLYGLSDNELLGRGIRPYIADKPHAFPDRVELRDVDVGERVLLLNYVSMALDTPYKASHAIFVRDGAVDAFKSENQVPDVLRRRVLSLRGFDPEGMLLEAAVVNGQEIEVGISDVFANADVAFIHVHNAAQGCYHARIDRV